MRRQDRGADRRGDRRNRRRTGGGQLADGGQCVGAGRRAVRPDQHREPARGGSGEGRIAAKGGAYFWLRPLRRIKKGPTVVRRQSLKRGGLYHCQYMPDGWNCQPLRANFFARQRIYRSAYAPISSEKKSARNRFDFSRFLFLAL